MALPSGHSRDHEKTGGASAAEMDVIEGKHVHPHWTGCSGLLHTFREVTCKSSFRDEEAETHSVLSKWQMQSPGTLKITAFSLNYELEQTSSR